METLNDVPLTSEVSASLLPPSIDVPGAAAAAAATAAVAIGVGPVDDVVC